MHLIQADIKIKHQYTEGKTAAGTDYYYTYGKNSIMEENCDSRNRSVLICRNHIQMQSVSEKHLWHLIKDKNTKKAVVTKIIKDNLAEDGKSLWNTESFSENDNWNLQRERKRGNQSKRNFIWSRL